MVVNSKEVMDFLSKDFEEFYKRGTPTDRELGMVFHGFKLATERALNIIAEQTNTTNQPTMFRLREIINFVRSS